MMEVSDFTVCVTCGCDGEGTTAERGCSCSTCHAQPGDFLGGTTGPLSEACDFAAEIAEEWRTRIHLRFTGRNIKDMPMWDALVPEELR